MSASGGSSSNSAEATNVVKMAAGGSVEAKYKPIGLDQLSVSLLTDCGHDSKLIFRGYLCRREKTAGGCGGDSSGTENSDEIFVLYWAILRAKQLFLFPNDDSNQCKEVIVLSQFVYHPDSPTGPPNWPKGFKSASLKSAQDSSCGSNSSGSSQESQHHLGWWPSHYRWHPHIRDQAAKAREDPASALTEFRQLLIAAKDLLAARSAATSAALAAAAANGGVAEFEEPQLPIKKEKAKPGFLNTLMRLRTYSRERSSSGAGGGGETDAASAVDSTSQKQPQQPPEPTSPDNDEEEELYMSLDDPPEGEDEASSLQSLNKENEETYEVPDEPPPTLPPAVPVKPPKPVLGVVTPEMLSSRKPLRPTPTPAPRGRSDDSDTAAVAAAAGSSDNAGEGLRQRRPSLSPTPAPRVPAAPAAAASAVECSLKEQVLSSEAVDAAVNYFYRAFDCKPQLQDAVSELEAAPVGTFVVHGGSCGRGGHLRLLTLLVRSGDSAHAVCRYTIKETASGVQIAGTLGFFSHSSINQLLYYYHIHDLPLCKGQAEMALRLVRPLHLCRRTSFLSASVWCLGDKPLCMSLLTGAQDGTFALLVDPQTKQLSLYATADGKQTVKMRINTEGQKLLQQQQKFWVSEAEKFDSLEEFLLHYHRHSVNVIAADSGGKQVPLRLATPCQLSEQFQANLKQHLTDHVTEEYTEGVQGNGGALLVSIRRLGGACVRTETPMDGDEAQPKLTTNGGRQSAGVLVEEPRVRGYQWIYRLDSRPEIEFDSLDKLLMYASQHPEKLA